MLGVSNVSWMNVWDCKKCNPEQDLAVQVSVAGSPPCRYYASLPISFWRCILTFLELLVLLCRLVKNRLNNFRKNVMESCLPLPGVQR